MPKITSAMLVATLVVWPVAAQTTSGMGVEDTPLRPSEMKLMQRIAAADPSFRYADRVKRYYRIHATTKNRIPLRVEMVLPQSNGLYFGEFIRYEVLVDEPGAMVTYQFDSGAAHRGSGTIVVTPRDVIKTERSCGTSSCQVRVERNGEVVYARKS